MKYEDLVKKIKEKDNNAIAEFYNEFYKDVYYLCLKITENEKDAEDVAQETLFRAVEKIDLLHSPEGLGAWLRTIANNLSINYIKKNRKFDIVDNVEMEEEDIFKERESDEQTPEDVVADKEVADILLKMIEKLPKEQRITIFMFYYEEMSVREISEAMDCSEATVRSRLNYAQKALRKQADELEDNGVKLRCIAILPFLATIYTIEKNTVCETIALPEIKIVNEKAESTTVKNNENKAVENAAKSLEGATSMTKTGISLGAKIAMGIGVVALAGGIAVGAIFMTSNGSEDKNDSGKHSVTKDKDKDNEGFQDNGNGEVVDEELAGLEQISTTPAHDLQFLGKFGDMDLCVSYDVPYQNPMSISSSYREKGTVLFHNGARHEMDYGTITVSLGSWEMEELFGQPFEGFYESVADRTFEVTSSKEVALDGEKAIYYEGIVDKGESYESKMAGYVVDFQGYPINVVVNISNTFSSSSAPSEEEKMKIGLEYAVAMILSFEEYGEESFVELSGSGDNIACYFRDTMEVKTDNYTYLSSYNRNQGSNNYPHSIDFATSNVNKYLNYMDSKGDTAQENVKNIMDNTLQGLPYEILSTEEYEFSGVTVEKIVFVEKWNLYGNGAQSEYYFPEQVTVLYGFVSDGKFIYTFDTQKVYDEECYTSDVLDRNEAWELPDESQWEKDIFLATLKADKMAGTAMRTLEKYDGEVYVSSDYTTGKRTVTPR